MQLLVGLELALVLFLFLLLVFRTFNVKGNDQDANVVNWY